ncbi:DUF296 domain-containing protein [Bradyrhizobium sp. 157]|uniref:PCC domain-containing protein n=1 Tax=Bradyrhizobium sp. 157 TaxID=2782631 RepID=UPI001FF794ED|nr:DUF296 domain-containing protein [Bradyrhizobium sp. 157]MCK1641367.1 DUF296 domain-containing protein [Bradyrhizobium sp. 157]
MKKRLGMRGRIEEIIYVRLEAGEDFVHALWEICKEYDIKTGILLDATGNFAKVRLMRISREPRRDNWGVDFLEIPGPLQVSATGILGTGWVPDNLPPTPEFHRHYPDTGFGAGGFEGHETPYFKINITVTNVSETVCGHLLQGSLVGGVNWEGGAEVPSHFTVAIAKVSGVILRATYDKSGFYHDLVPA